MNAKEVIQHIDSIYAKYPIPKNLKQHMLRVTAVAEFVCDHWKGPQIDKDAVIAISLVHDLGNIVKMNFETEQGISMLEEEDKERIEYWKRQKKKAIERFGKSDHDANNNIVKELGLETSLQYLMENKVFVHNDIVASSTKWELKICTYADQRVGPFGILSLKERFDDFQKRYFNNPGPYAGIDVSNMIAQAYDFEKQIQQHVDIPLDNIDDECVSHYLHKYLRD